MKEYTTTEEFNKLLDEAGIAQFGLANIVNVSRQTVSNWAKHNRRVPIEIAYKLQDIIKGEYHGADAWRAEMNAGLFLCMGGHTTPVKMSVHASAPESIDCPACKNQQNLSVRSYWVGSVHPVPYSVSEPKHKFVKGEMVVR